MKSVTDAKEAALLDVREKYGDEVERAMRDHLAIINERFYLWLADLYIPRKCVCDNFDAEGNRICLLPRDKDGKCTCTGGGFYYSNSARESSDFNIDIESTVQAIRFLHTSGMLADFGGSYMKALPKQMQKDLCAFAKGLQDPEDGYFYHPKWGKDILPSRQGRDLGWATGIIHDLGDMPLYDTKNGYKGTLGAPSGVVEQEDGKTDNSTWVSHLRTLDSFKDYLSSFDLKTRSYHCGNNINAQARQIIQRDKQAILDGEVKDSNGDGIADDGFVRAFEKYFGERQNHENGLWEEDVHYYSMNGLMKIATSYNTFGLKFNYAKEAFESAIKITLIGADETDCKGVAAYGATEVFNPWVVMSTLISNTEKFGTEGEHKELLDMLSKNLAVLIKATTEKTKKFMKPDGSFGCTWDAPPHTTQGTPVCPPGFIEGDVNGGTIATGGIFAALCETLGIKVPIFSGEDFEAFSERIKKNCGYR